MMTISSSDIAPPFADRTSVLVVDNTEAVIDTDPDGNNTLYPVSRLMEVMKRRNMEEKPFYDEFQVSRQAFDS